MKIEAPKIEKSWVRQDISGHGYKEVSGIFLYDSQHKYVPRVG